MMTKAKNLKKLFFQSEIKLAIKDLEVQNKQLYFKDCLFVLDNNELKLCIFKDHHNSSIQEHSKHKNIYAKLLKKYF